MAKCSAPGPLIVAIGGTVKPGSSTERALGLAVEAVKALGAEVIVFDGAYLTALPHYGGPDHSDVHGQDLVDAVRRADGVIIASPGYHGSISGVVKNGLDFLEALSQDARPYLDGRVVGLIATAYGDQAATSTLVALRTVAHALRGWPTPMGVAIRSHAALFSPDGGCLDERIIQQISVVAQQVVTGAKGFKFSGESRSVSKA
jgi:FMN reductase